MRSSLRILLVALLTFILMSFTAFAASDTNIDTSTADDGYFRAKCTSSNRIKVLVEKDGQKYTYDLNNSGNFENFSLQMGNGSYTIKIMENVVDNKYAKVDSATVTVNLKNQLSPFLVTNQQVNYSSSSKAITKANELSKTASTTLGKVESLYNFVTKNLTYDTNKAKTVQTGYLPNIDSTLDSKTGICYDYASLMAAMLRSQGIPTKLVKGYVAPSNVYHAWNEVYLENEGWVNINEVYFDGKDFKRMDPTFASSGSRSSSILKFIGNGSNYSKTYEY